MFGIPSENNATIHGEGTRPERVYTVVVGVDKYLERRGD